MKAGTRLRLILLVAAILVSGFLVTNIVSYQVSRDSLLQTLISNELPLTSNNVYSEIQADLLRPIFISSLMAGDTFVKDWLHEGEEDADRITRYLDAIRTRYDTFTSFLVSERSRTYYHYTGPSKAVSDDDQRDEWFFRVREMNEPYEINIDFNAQADDSLTVFINYRITEPDGTFLAVTGVGLSLDTLSKIVSAYERQFGRNIYFIDGDGVIQIRSEGASMNEKRIQDIRDLSDKSDRIFSAEQESFRYKRDGDTFLMTTRHIPELKWWVLVEQSEDEAMRNIRGSLLTNSAVGLVVVAATILIVVYIINRFQSRLEEMATTDKLTGIGNRQVFDINLDHLLRRRGRTQAPFSVIMLDIDHFKRVNDEFGHLKGDDVIREVARLTRDAIRKSDILCRWGGEELIILAEDCNQADAVAMAEKIRTTICQSTPVHLEGGLPLTVSLGVTQFRDGDDADAILARADRALYQAKNAGRDRVAES